jgi:hypothetical protein
MMQRLRDAGALLLFFAALMFGRDPTEGEYDPY